jgi:alginate O-acetyltransferase complex protein AlgJ
MHKILLICLLIPVFVGISGLGRGSLELENRARVVMPDFPRAVADWPEYFTKIDAFISDNIGGRDQLIAMKKSFELAINGYSNSKVIAGSDGWLFYNAHDVIDRDSGHQFVPFRVTNIVNYALEMQDLAQKNGAKFLVIPVPNKSAIYRKYLPTWAQVEGTPKTERAAIVELLKEKDVPLVDPFAIFEGFDLDSTPLYFKRDTHWNDFGAYVVFFRAMSEFGLQKDLPTPDTILLGYSEGKQYGVLDQFLGFSTPAESEPLPNLDMSVFTNFPELSFREFDDHVSMDSFEIKYSPAKPKLLVVGDSFTYGLVVGDSFTYGFFRQYWGAVFGEVRWSHHDYGAYDRSGIEEFKPDYVIFEFVDWEVPAWRKFKPLDVSN